MESCLLDSGGHFQDAIGAGGDLPSESQGWCSWLCGRREACRQNHKPTCECRVCSIYLISYPDVQVLRGEI